MRDRQESQIPVLMVQGTLDLATPVENDEHLLEFFPKGKLVRVVGGTHAAPYHAASVDKNFIDYLSTFMNSDDPVAHFADMPSEITMPPLKFRSSESKPLFNMMKSPVEK